MPLEELFRVRLRQILTAAGVAPSELAHRLQVSPSMVSHLLSGRKSPGLEMIERIATALGTSPQELLFAKNAEPVRGTAIEKRHEHSNDSGMDELLTVSEAATLIGTSDQMIRRHCRNGVLPAKETSAGYLIRKSDLEKYSENKPRWGGPRRKSSQVA